jgi:hypothetical protein
MPFFGIRGIAHLLSGESGFFSLLCAAFTIWMLVECVRKDPEKYTWLWIILIVPGVGPMIYFFVRWLPERNLQPPAWLRGLTRGSEIRRLQSAAVQIGNPYHHVQLGDAMRETWQFERALDAYERALEKEPTNLSALWGAGLIELHSKSYEAARVYFEKIMQLDPQFKFGDASLAYAKTLINLQRTDEAIDLLEQHAKRWRTPEAVYLLATLYAQTGRDDAARSHLQTMLLDIDASPLSIARKQSAWGRRGRQLLKKLGTAR